VAELGSLSLMKTLLLALAITLLFASLCLGQQESYAYGQPSDLKGLKKVYIDTGADTKSRDSIIKDLQKSKLSFEIMDDLEDAEILLGFGAGEVTRKANGNNFRFYCDDAGTVRTYRSRGSNRTC